MRYVLGVDLERFDPLSSAIADERLAWRDNYADCINCYVLVNAGFRDGFIVENITRLWRYSNVKIAVLKINAPSCLDPAKLE